MRWTVRLELVDDEGAKREVEVFAIERPTAVTEAEVGLVDSVNHHGLSDDIHPGRLAG